MDQRTEEVTCAWCNWWWTALSREETEPDRVKAISCYHIRASVTGMLYLFAVPLSPTPAEYFTDSGGSTSGSPAAEALALRTLLHAATCSPLSVCVTLPRGLLSGKFD